MKLAWATDPHFNFASVKNRDRFISDVKASANGLLITGDISEAEDVCWQLQQLHDELQMPIYFVLGNHDFYHGSIAETRRAVELLCTRCPELRYLTGAAEPTFLDAEWTLCGDDGWADGRIGDYYRSPVTLTDFQLIEELKGLTAQARLRVLRRQASGSAMRLRAQLENARATSNRSIVLTHLPPFRESCWYEGKHSDDDWAPFFTCYAVGWMLRKFCERYAEHEILVLCGHTHGSGLSRILPNLVVWTGAAEYGVPAVSHIIDLESPNTTLSKVLDDRAFDWSAT